MFLHVLQIDSCEERRCQGCRFGRERQTHRWARPRISLPARNEEVTSPEPHGVCSADSRTGRNVEIFTRRAAIMSDITLIFSWFLLLFWYSLTWRLHFCFLASCRDILAVSGHLFCYETQMLHNCDGSISKWEFPLTSYLMKICLCGAVTKLGGPRPSVIVSVEKLYTVPTKSQNLI